MGLVSALYAMGPSPAVTGPERDKRNRLAVKRVLATHDLLDVLDRIRDAPETSVRQDLVRLIERAAVLDVLRAR